MCRGAVMLASAAPLDLILTARMRSVGWKVAWTALFAAAALKMQLVAKWGMASSASAAATCNQVVGRFGM
jgi:hypothetical protein